MAALVKRFVFHLGMCLFFSISTSESCCISLDVCGAHGGVKVQDTRPMDKWTIIVLLIAAVYYSVVEKWV